MRYTDHDLTAIVRRALHIEHDLANLTESQVVDIAREVGISDEAVQAALTEHRRNSVTHAVTRYRVTLRWPMAICLGWFVGLFISRWYDWHHFNLPSQWLTLVIGVTAGMLAARDRRPSRFQIANAALWISYLAMQLYEDVLEIPLGGSYRFPAWTVARLGMWWLVAAAFGFLLNRAFDTWDGTGAAPGETTVRRIREVARRLVFRALHRIDVQGVESQGLRSGAF
ncbi:MAG TPA: hypothetical protein VGM77_02920 [Gemmatimonadales bacterium]|jgi:hypothetical protein